VSANRSLQSDQSPSYRRTLKRTVQGRYCESKRTVVSPKSCCTGEDPLPLTCTGAPGMSTTGFLPHLRLLAAHPAYTARSKSSSHCQIGAAMISSPPTCQLLHPESLTSFGETSTSCIRTQTAAFPALLSLVHARTPDPSDVCRWAAKCGPSSWSHAATTEATVSSSITSQSRFFNLCKPTVAVPSSHSSRDCSSSRPTRQPRGRPADPPASIIPPTDSPTPTVHPPTPGSGPSTAPDAASSRARCAADCRSPRCCPATRSGSPRG